MAFNKLALNCPRFTNHIIRILYKIKTVGSARPPVPPMHNNSASKVAKQNQARASFVGYKRQRHLSLEQLTSAI